MSLKELILIIRPLNCLMAVIATIIGYLLSLNTFSFNPLLVNLIVSVFFVCAFGQTINDFFDRNVDKKLHSEKPIPSGKLSSNTVLIYSLILALIGIAAAFLVNSTAFNLAVIFSILLFVYSAFMPSYKYFGNFLVAVSTGFTFIMGATLTGNYFIPAFLAATAIMSNLSRELIKDLEDFKGDRGFKITLPQIISEKKCIELVLFYYLVAIFLSYALPFAAIQFKYSFLQHFVSIPYLVVISIANILLLISFKHSLKKNFFSAQKFSKYGMLTALIAFIVTAILKFI